MLGFVVRQLRYRRGRVATLAAGILVAAASFVLLTSAAQTSELQVKGTVAKNFRAAYDILVRPKDTFTQIEKQRGLIRANYLSGIFGGITFKQSRIIRHLPGVDVAAPIANIGYILPFTFVPLPINNIVTKDRTGATYTNFRWSGARMEESLDIQKAITMSTTRISTRCGSTRTAAAHAKSSPAASPYRCANHLRHRRHQARSPCTGETTSRVSRL